MSAQDILKKANTIVIKVGSVLVTDKEKGVIKQEWLDTLAQDIKALTDQGKKIVIVSSGGIAMGRNALGIAKDTPPAAIPLEQKQAASAVGQFYLFQGYHKAFETHGLSAAQILLTMSETENRRMHLNARETLYTLMNQGIVPVINENDTVSTGEIRFGDNDRLAARVAQMIEAHAIILLSTIDGLYTQDPGKNPSAEHIPVIENITDEHLKMAGDAIPGLSTGGMKSKIEAAQAATRAGIDLIIAEGTVNNPVQGVVDQKAARTSLFLAQETSSNARKRWIQAHLSPKGSVFIDQGALDALKNGKSLLPVGIKRMEGSFERGDAINIRTMEGYELGIGLSAYSAQETEKIIGKNSADIQDILGYAGREELIHRNDMALNL